MKTRLLFLFTVLLCLPFIVLAQSPQKFNYQAVLRDVSGNPITDSDIGIKLTILQGSASGTTVCTEEFISTTNSYGLMTIEVGSFNEVDFNAIDWSDGPYFLKVEVDQSGGTSYTEMGTTQLLSVPYALHAATAAKSLGDSLWQQTDNHIYYNKGMVGINTANPEAPLHVNGSIKTFSGSGTVLYGMTNPSGVPDGDGFRIRWDQDWQDNQYLDALIFEKTDFNSDDPDGLITFINTGVDGIEEPALTVRGSGRVGVGTDSPSGKLGVESESTWSDEIPLFEVKNKDGTPVFAVFNNGVRVLIEDDPAKKGPKGGFAIGGFDRTKAGSTVEFMRISPDSIRFNINNSASKGPKGGFAIGGFDRTKGAINEDFMYITPQSTDQGLYNTFLGYKAGEANTSWGKYNCYFGYESGRNNTNGSYNTFLGYQAGINSRSSWNTFIGFKAGLSTTGASNVFIGHGAGENSQAAHINVFIGKNAGNDNVSGSENTYVGHGAGAANQTGSSNTFIGGKSGLTNGGGENTLIGSQAMPLNTSGNENVAIGYQAGYQNTSGSGNVYLGYKAGRNDTGSGRLYIDNSDTSSPLIYGDFSTDRLNINGEMRVYGNSTANYALVTNGGQHLTRSLYVYKGAYTTGSWQTSSDIRYKNNIRPIEDALDIIESINGVRFCFNTADFSDMGFSDKQQVGVIAQDIEKVLPELVTEDEDGYKAVAYDKLTSVLVEAVKGQQEQIENQHEEINVLNSRINMLEQMVMEMAAREE